MSRCNKGKNMQRHQKIKNAHHKDGFICLPIIRISVLDALNFHKTAIPSKKIDHCFGSITQYFLTNQAPSSITPNNIGNFSSELSFPIHMTNHGIGAGEDIESK